MSPRKAKFLTQDHTASKSQSQDLNQKTLGSGICALNPNAMLPPFSVCKERMHYTT